MPEYAYIYILANGFRKLYIGVTNNLERRVAEHKQKLSPHSHTARYNITQLVYFERFGLISAAIAREKQLKGWLRIRKLDLIIGTNPHWHDLSADWGRPVELYPRTGPDKPDHASDSPPTNSRDPSLCSG